MHYNNQILIFDGMGVSVIDLATLEYNPNVPYGSMSPTAYGYTATIIDKEVVVFFGGN